MIMDGLIYCSGYYSWVEVLKTMNDELAGGCLYV